MAERNSSRIVSKDSTPSSLVSRLKELHHKPGVDKNDWDKVHKNLLKVAEHLLDHCYSHNLPLIITSIIRPKIKGVSKTDIHSTGRAFDISVRGWSADDIAFLVFVMNDDLKFGAISARSGKENEVIYEDGIKLGTAPHLHFQVRP